MISIRRAESDADLELCADIAGAVESTRPTLDQLRTVREHLLLDSDGGYAYVNRSSIPGSAYAMVRVLPDRRGHGIGSRCLGRA